MSTLRLAVLTICYLLSIGRAFAWSNYEDHGLFSRQSSTGTGSLNPADFPAPCQAGCATIIDAISACGTSLACKCTTANAHTLLTCVDCVVGYNYTVAVNVEGQAELDTFKEACTAGGFTVPPLVVSVSISGATATAAGNTATGNQIATVTAGKSGSTETSNPFAKISAASLMVERAGLVVATAAAAGIILLCL